MSVPAVFLDRDGVLSRAVVVDGQPRTPMRADDFEVLADAAPSCRRLREAGFVLVVVTNQPDVARGFLPADELGKMHDVLRELVAVDDVLVCPHDDRDGCSCRKPKPGLVLEAAAIHGIDLAASYLVGDRWRDIEAGRGAGCRTVLIDHQWREKAAQGADAVVSDLAAAVAWIEQQPCLAAQGGAA